MLPAGGAAPQFLLRLQCYRCSMLIRLHFTFPACPSVLKYSIQWINRAIMSSQVLWQAPDYFPTDAHHFKATSELRLSVGCRFSLPLHTRLLLLLTTLSEATIRTFSCFYAESFLGTSPLSLTSFALLSVGDVDAPFRTCA